MPQPHHILVIGKTGQLGSAYQHLAKCPQEALPQKLTILGRPEADLTDPSSLKNLISQYQPHLIINAAAYTAVDEAEDHPNQAFTLNALAPHHLAAICAEINTPLIHLSTDYVFSGQSTTPYEPHDSPAPINTYGRSKLAGEWACTAAHPHGAYIIRTSWVFSPWGKNFVKTILQLAETRNEITVVNDQNGSPTSALDLARATLQIAEKIISKQVSSPGLYHYSNTGTCTWHRFAEEILKQKSTLLDPTSSEAFPTKALRPTNSMLNTTKIQDTFQLSIPNWQVALQETLKQLHA